MSDVRASDIAMTLSPDAAEQLAFAHKGTVWVPDRSNAAAIENAQKGLVTLDDAHPRGFQVLITRHGRDVAELVIEEVRLRRALARVDAPLEDLLGVPAPGESCAA